MSTYDSNELLERVRAGMKAIGGGGVKIANDFDQLDKIMVDGKFPPTDWKPARRKSGRPRQRKTVLKETVHGLKGYREGCGCDVCTQANTDRAAMYRHGKEEA